MTNLQYIMAVAFRGDPEMLATLEFLTPEQRFALGSQTNGVASAGAEALPLAGPKEGGALPHAEKPATQPKPRGAHKRPKAVARQNRIKARPGFGLELASMATGPERPSGYWYDLEQAEKRARREVLGL